MTNQLTLTLLAVGVAVAVHSSSAIKTLNLLLALIYLKRQLLGVSSNFHLTMQTGYRVLQVHCLLQIQVWMLSLMLNHRIAILPWKNF